MLWGCKIRENTPYEISANGRCVLRISNISLKFGPKDSIIKIHLKKKNDNNDILISTLKQNKKEEEKINSIINLSEDDIYNIYVSGGKAEVHLIGSLMLFDKKDLKRNKTLLKKNKNKAHSINDEYENLRAIKEEEDIDQILERKRTLSK
jgi:hypothetical protein